MHLEPLMEEKRAKRCDGLKVLILNIVLTLTALAKIAFGAVVLAGGGESPVWILLIILCSIYVALVSPLVFTGLKIVKPNEALVLTLFGNYYGSLRGPGFFFVHPFASAVLPPQAAPTSGAVPEKGKATGPVPVKSSSTPWWDIHRPSRKISLKAMTLNNDRQKVNDAQGNPIIIGVVVVWKVVNTAKAIFNVDNYIEYLSIQCDSALRNIVRLYPYDASEEAGEQSLRGSSQTVAERLQTEIQDKIELAGLEILEARITHLSYAPEIAAAMLQRQQAGAMIAARQLIVDGAVSMVEMALDKLSAKHIVDLDEERKATMVSNLLVVLCGNKDVQPVVNSGSIY